MRILDLTWMIEDYSRAANVAAVGTKVRETLVFFACQQNISVFKRDRLVEVKLGKFQMESLKLMLRCGGAISVGGGKPGSFQVDGIPVNQIGSTEAAMILIFADQEFDACQPVTQCHQTPESLKPQSKKAASRKGSKQSSRPCGRSSKKRKNRKP